MGHVSLPGIQQLHCAITDHSPPGYALKYAGEGHRRLIDIPTVRRCNIHDFFKWHGVWCLESHTGKSVVSPSGQINCFPGGKDVLP